MLTDARMARGVAILLPSLILYCIVQTLPHIIRAAGEIGSIGEIAWLLMGWFLATGEYVFRHPFLYLSLCFLLAIAAMSFYLRRG